MTSGRPSIKLKSLDPQSSFNVSKGERSSKQIRSKWLPISRLYYKVGDFQHALSFLREYLGLEPQDYQANLLAARVLTRLNDHRAALLHYDRVLSVNNPAISVAAEAIQCCLEALKKVTDQHTVKEISSQGIYWASRILRQSFEGPEKTTLDTIAGIFRELLRATTPSQDYPVDGDVFASPSSDMNDWIEAFEVDKLLRSPVANDHVPLQAVLLEALMRRQWGQKIAWAQTMENEVRFSDSYMWHEWKEANFDKFDPICIAISSKINSESSFQNDIMTSTDLKKCLFEYYPLLWQLIEADQALRSMSVVLPSVKRVELIFRMMDLLDGAHVMVANRDSSLYFQQPLGASYVVDVNDQIDWWRSVLKEFSARLLQHHSEYLASFVQFPNEGTNFISEGDDDDNMVSTVKTLCRISYEYRIRLPSFVRSKRIGGRHTSNPSVSSISDVLNPSSPIDSHIPEPSPISDAASNDTPTECDEPESLASIKISIPRAKRRNFRAKSPQKRGHIQSSNSMDTGSTMKGAHISLRQYRWIFLSELQIAREQELQSRLKVLEKRTMKQKQTHEELRSCFQLNTIGESLKPTCKIKFFA